MIEYELSLKMNESEKELLEERIRNDGSTPEIWIKKAICAFSDGMLFCGDDVWGREA